MKNFRFASLIAVLILFSSACNQGEAPEPDRHPAIQFEADLAEEMKQVSEASAAKVLAKLELKNGNLLHFIDEGLEDHAQIGVVELTKAGNGALLPELVKGERWTALELYQSLSPAAAPKQLILNHEEMARHDADIPLSPRTIETALSPQAVETSYCFDLPSDLHFDAISTANSAFGSVPPNHAHIHDATATHYLTTGASAQRLLATCNASGYVKKVEIFYRTNLVIYNPSYPWVPVNPWKKLDLGFEWTFPNTSVIYYSSHSPLIASWLKPRYRLKVGFTWSGSNYNRAHSEGLW